MFSIAALTPILPVNADLSHWPIWALAFIIGICLGSFAGAAGLRLNRDEDVVKAPSRCRGCDKKLGVWDNLPLIGWLKTWGKCRQCGAKFSIQYMMVELTMGLLTALLFGFYPPLVAAALTIGIMLAVICAITDLDQMLLHLPVMVGLGAIGFILSLMPFWPVAPLTSILGMVVVVMLISVINGVYHLIRGEAGFGSGDYWLLGAIGLWMGPVFAVALFFLSAFAGAIIGIILMALNRGTGQTALPFGIFISLVFICWPILNILVIVVD